MNIGLDINARSCIECGKCASVCPSMILTQAESGEIMVNNRDTCIVCGHCVAVCPTSSVEHSEFPKSKVHEIDYEAMPSAEQVMLLMKSRRSNRAFSDKPIPTDYIDTILEAAHRAPTASNRQQVAFTLVTDPVKLKAITEFTLNTFEDMLKKAENPLLKPVLKKIMPDVYKYVSVFQRLRREYDLGNDGILRNATAVILIHSPQKNRFGAEDTNLAYQNGSLMAECLGVSQFYMGFVLTAIRQNKGKLEKMLGIEGKIESAMALGMPEFRFPNYIDRQPIVVDRQ